MQNKTETAPVALPELTPEQEQLLRQKFAAEKQAEKDKKAKYKEIASGTVTDVIKVLQSAANNLADAKQKAYDELTALLDTKLEVYEVKNNQKTHMFSSADGQYRIITGVRLLTRWDGTESAGVEKVRQYITSLAKDENSAHLTTLVMRLLNPDKQGNLNPNRVMQLVKLKDKITAPLFGEGVDIIVAAYQPIESAPFIEAYERQPDGKFKNVELRFANLEIKEQEAAK